MKLVRLEKNEVRYSVKMGAWMSSGPTFMTTYINEESCDKLQRERDRA